MLAGLYYQANNINFLELRDALNSKWNVQILEPRDGIGGHCLPKDTKIFLHSKSIRSKILGVAMDEDYKRYRAKLYSQPEKKISIFIGCCLPPHSMLTTTSFMT